MALRARTPEREELAYVPVLRHPMEVKGGEVMETQSGRSDESERPDKSTVKTLARAAEREKMLLSALRALGFSTAEARERASEVLERISDRAESLPEGDLIKEDVDEDLKSLEHRLHDLFIYLGNTRPPLETS